MDEPLCPICHRPLATGKRSKTCGAPDCQRARSRQRKGLPLVGKTDFCDGCGGPGPFTLETVSPGIICRWCRSCQKLEAKETAA